MADPKPYKNFWELTRSGRSKRKRKESILSSGADHLFDGGNGEPAESILPSLESCIDSENPLTREMFLGDSFPEIPHEAHFPEMLDNDNYSEMSDDDSSVLEWSSKSDSFYMHDKLANWAVKHCISHSALNDLLFNLKSHHCFRTLPSDSRTLLKTPKSFEIVPVSPGQYSHIGIALCLLSIWQNFSLQVKERISEISILIGIDGLPLFKSSSSEFWPILGVINDIPFLKPIVFPIGIYFGNKKPNSCAEFLQKFLLEAGQLIRNGLPIGDKILKISIKGFVCDAPAKSFILNVKGHTGYSSCTKCTQAGKWLENRTTFQESNAPKRTHDSFVRYADEDFHMGETPLTSLPGIDFINSFPLDYMHLVCLGVVRTLLLLWNVGPVPIKLPSSIINEISSELLNLSSHIPQEFNRKPRSLMELKRWKATEFRTFLIYTGPVVLKKVFKGTYEEIYNNFLSLSIAISILLSKEFHFNSEMQEYAHNLLLHFLSTIKKLYGKKFITHNFHGLVHLTDTVQHFGSLDLCNAFPFENFMQLFKRLIRKGDKPLQQVVRRLHEGMQTNSFFSSDIICEEILYRKPHSMGPLLPTSNCHKQFEVAEFPAFTVSNSHPNSCCVLKCGSIVIVENIVFSNESKEMSILCREYTSKEHFFMGPKFIESGRLLIFVVSNLSKLIEKPITEIRSKMVHLPFENKNVTFPLLHSS